MTNNKQSSVEWLIEQILLKHPIITQFLPNWNFDKSIIEQAKAMEKKQCVDFALKCMLNGLEPHKSTREVIEKLFDEGLQ